MFKNFAHVYTLLHGILMYDAITKKSSIPKTHWKFMYVQYNIIAMYYQFMLQVPFYTTSYNNKPMCMHIN